MPAVAKSYLPAFAGFMVCALTYTTVVATKEGATIDGARSRWQNQHARAQLALSHGMTLADMEAKH